jgi:DNA-binding GntR family transcriptional regulator
MYMLALMNAPVFVRSRTLAHSIADDLRHLIEQGEYPPGAALRQEEIADRFGVSRIPLREAFRLLEADGLVAVHANRGAFVLQHGKDEIAELFDLRLMLEGDLLRRACQCISDDVLRALETANALLAATRDPEEWIHRDEEFHFSMYAAADRPQTLSLARTLRRSLNAYYLRYLGPRLRAVGWTAEHSALLRAVRHKDSLKAFAVLEQHLRQTQKALLAALARRPTHGGGSDGRV